MLAYLAYLTQCRPGLSVSSVWQGWIPLAVAIFIVLPLFHVFLMRGYWARVAGNRDYVTLKMTSHLPRPLKQERKKKQKALRFSWISIAESALMALMLYFMTKVPAPKLFPSGRRSWSDFIGVVAHFFALYTCVLGSTRDFDVVDFRGHEWTRTCLIFQGLCLTVLFFSAASIIYDEHPSPKPAWLDWLG